MYLFGFVNRKKHNSKTIIICLVMPQQKMLCLAPNHTGLGEGCARGHLRFEEIQVSIENLKIGLKAIGPI